MGVVLIVSSVENFGGTGPRASSRSGVENVAAKRALGSLAGWAGEILIDAVYPLSVLWTNESLQPLQLPTSKLQKHCTAREI